MRPIESVLEDALRASIERIIGTPWTGAVPVEVSNRPELGDYASAVAFSLAASQKRAPLEIAGALAADLVEHGGDLFSNVEAVAPAFLNLRIATSVLHAIVASAHDAHGALGDRPSQSQSKTLIEHTNINPNKAAHVGHFRNACLGDTVARMLARLGEFVEVQNYIDDTGVQVADLVAGLRFLDPPAEDGRPFDRYCSDVYVLVQQTFEDKPELAAYRSEVQAAVEDGHGELAEFARSIVTRVVDANLATMARAGVGYDLLTWESDILALGFWRRAFDKLRDSGAIRLEADGPNAGCWVVPFGVGTVETGEGTVTEDKVLITSHETVTYTAKDIAYQMWKFGVLGSDFAFRRWTGSGMSRNPETGMWTTARDGGDLDEPHFAGADRVINVIDDRQAYPQQVVYDCMRRMGFVSQADASEHLSYAVVNLSPAAARELGVPVDDKDKGKPVAMSGRGGIQVFADELLDRLEAKVRERTGDDASAAAIAVGAARYYMLKFSNSQIITFDFDEALRTAGETGVYLQYAIVRAGGILRKNVTNEQAAPSPAPPPDAFDALDRNLVLAIARYPQALESAATERSPQTLAKYAFELATTFNSFYDNTTPIVQEKDEIVAAWRMGLVHAFRLVLSDVLDVLGIPVLERI